MMNQVVMNLSNVFPTDWHLKIAKCVIYNPRDCYIAPMRCRIHKFGVHKIHSSPAIKRASVY